MYMSEVAYIKQKIRAEYEAAQRGLSGLSSGTARHDFIQAKTENIGKYHEELAALIGPEEAIALIANTIWSPIEQGKTTGELSSGNIPSLQ
jgi:hypothetical protein